MKFLKSLLGVVLVAGVGCQASPLMNSIAPLTGQQIVSAPVEEASKVADLLPTINAVTKPVAENKGEIQFSISWPERPRTTQAIPNSANTLRVRIYEDGQPDLYNEVITRPSPDPYSGQTQTVTKTYCLDNDIDYRLEVKAYAETAAALNANSVALAFTNPYTPVRLTGQGVQNVAIHLTPLYSPVLTTKNYGGGANATIVVAGSGFGTNKSQISAICKYSESAGDYATLAVQDVTDNAVTLNLPSSFWNQGTLVLKRDGIAATGAVTLKPVSELYFGMTNIKKENSWDPNPTSFYAITNTAYTLTPTPRNNNVSLSSIATWSVGVVTDANTGDDVTSSVYQNGQFTFPDTHHYQIEFKSGSVSRTMDLYGTTLNWGANPSNIRVCPYTNPLPQTSPIVSLGSKSLGKADNSTISFNKDDFNWSYSQNDVVMIDPNDSSVGQVKFKACNADVATASVTVTGALKYDPSKVVQFNADLVRVQSATLQYYSPSSGSWANVPSGGLNLTLNGYGYYNNYSLRVKTMTLTNNVTYTLTYDQWGNLVGEGSIPLNCSSSNEDVLTTASNTLTCVTAGSAIATVKHTEEPNTLLSTVNVTVNPIP